MNTTAINKILQNCSVTAKYYQGCFACDTISRNTLYPCSIVINFDSSMFTGSHWVAVFATSPFQAFYFDSLSMDSPSMPIINYLSAFKHVYRNKIRFQNLNSNICGKYVVVFIYFMSKYLNFNKFITLLSSHDNADYFINEFYRKIYSNCIL